MKCPFCVEAGLRSTIHTSGYGAVTLMGHHTFYDEDGKYHSHDPNWRSQSYSCSNLHVWYRSTRGGCCANDPFEEKITRKPDRFRCATCNEIDSHESLCPQAATDNEHPNRIHRLADHPRPWLSLA